MNTKQFFEVWKNVFGDWRYVLFAIFIAVFFYTFNVVIAGWKSLAGFYQTVGLIKTVNLFFVLFLGFKEILTLSSFASLLVISILFGILFSMLAYKAHFNLSVKDKEFGFFGSIGLFLAAFVPGCAACGVGLASVVGLGAGALAFLPYKGLELSILAIIILGITIFKATENMYVCMVPSGKKSKQNNK